MYFVFKNLFFEILCRLAPTKHCVLSVWQSQLGQQLQCSSNSVPANIAEGYGRFYYQDNIRFCYNARGSLEETLSHLVVCFDLKYISKELFDSLEQDGEKLTQLINGYIGYLKRSKQGQNEPGANHSVREDSASYDMDIPEAG